MNAVVSVIICTQNRAEALKATLAGLRGVAIPPGWWVEAIVVDNDSTDDTARVVSEAAIDMPLTYVREPRRGVSNARNTGLATARGEIALCIDDDLIAPPNWIEGMCAPILSGAADAVAGGVRIAPNLLMPWMDLWHKAWLASSECLEAPLPARLIGANMALRMSVLERVPHFDPELGVGALGMAEETLFSMQLRRAGLRIVSAEDVVCLHHFSPARLSRSAFLDSARRLGRSDAYIAHHWEHTVLPRPQVALIRALARLAYYKVRHAFHVDDAPVKVWEMQLVRDIYFVRGYMAECKRPRNYELHGLRRLDDPASAGHTLTNARQIVNAS
ncbi:MAG: glycosyltransferase family 2 protein [Capsulimonadaceae bacterium]|nr:glycosyltransferase family 2 protein [Capsulimonadaceae bacterium]